MSRWLAFLGNRRVELRERPVPRPGPRQVLVRTVLSQISAGSEMNGFLHRTAEDEPRPGGYTAVGIVEQVGSAVEGVEPGQRVLYGGNHADHHLVNLDEPTWKRCLLPLPDNVTFEQATFAILGDVALHGIRRARLQIDQSVAIFGLGVVGQLTSRLARLSGAHPIVAVDPLADRRRLSTRFGASVAVDPRQGDVADEIRRITGGDGAAAVFHVTTNPRVFVDCLRSAAPRGTVVLTGSAPGTVEIGLQVELLRRELTVLGVYEAGLEGEPHPYWPWTRDRNRLTIFHLIPRGELDVGPLISHVAEPERAQEIYQMVAAGGEGWLSVLFRWA